jgi:GTP-binding protein HflX
VVDVSNPRCEDQMESVKRILEQLELHQKPTIVVFNKMDLAHPQVVERKLARHGGVAISAMRSETLKPLILAMQDEVETFLTEDWPSLPTSAAGSELQPDIEELEDSLGGNADSDPTPGPVDSSGQGS